MLVDNKEANNMKKHNRAVIIIGKCFKKLQLLIGL